MVGARAQIVAVLAVGAMLEDVAASGATATNSSAAKPGTSSLLSRSS